MEYSDNRGNRPGNRMIWLYGLVAILIVVLVLLGTRSCRGDHGGYEDMPPVYSDSLEGDTGAVPPPSEGSGVDDPDNTRSGNGTDTLGDSATRTSPNQGIDPATPGVPGSPSAPATPAMP